MPGIKNSRMRQRKAVARSGVQPPSVLQWAGLTSPRVGAFFILLGLVLVSGLGVVNTTHKSRFAFSELQELRDQANDLDVQWGQLLIEQSTFGLEGRIEQKAAQQLHMQVPELSNIVMISND